MITYNLSSFFYPPLDVFYPISDKAWEERKQDTDVCWMALCPLNLAWLKPTFSLVVPFGEPQMGNLLLAVPFNPED